jgi:hypothetical protein
LAEDKASPEFPEFPKGGDEENGTEKGSEKDP